MKGIWWQNTKTGQLGELSFIYFGIFHLSILRMDSIYWIDQQDRLVMRWRLAVQYHGMYVSGIVL